MYIIWAAPPVQNFMYKNVEHYSNVLTTDSKLLKNNVVFP